jgi:hypothetical protein
MGIESIGATYVRLAVIGAGLVLVGSLSAQNPPAAPASDSQSSDSEGKEIGGFRVTQSIEIGGRISDVTGSQAMYDTLLNYQSGPRILEQSLTMQSVTHQDIFDTLTLSSFGFGGDPEQAARLRVAKYNWYTFTGSYQHISNFFDYNLLANPLNPPTGSPFVPILDSPHTYFDHQNIYNFGLVALPMHRLSFRVDYNRNRIMGPSYSSVHEGTDALLNQDWNDQLNGFRFGADYRINPKTTLSYTQSLQYYTGGTTYDLNSFNSYPLANGTLVSLGLPWLNGGSPCSAPLKKGIANPTCNGFLGYSFFQHENTSIPTEQVNLRSSSLKWLDFNGQYQYSHANMSTPLTEAFRGLISRSGLLGFDTSGSQAKARWNSSSVDVSATIYVSDRMRLVDTFRFHNFSVAGNLLDLETNFYNAASAGSASLLQTIATFPPTPLTHASGSPADIINEVGSNLIGQNTKGNDFQVQYDVTRLFGVRVGFDYLHNTIQPGSSYSAALGDIYFPNNPNRGDCAGLPLNPDGSCTFTGVLEPFGNPTTTINRYAAVLGAWFRKGSVLHADINARFGGADNWIYRTDPLKFVDIKANVSYAPQPWLMLGGNFIYERGSNNTNDINFKQHNYVTMATATIMPGKRWGFDLAYNFDAIQQNMFLCFQGTLLPPDTAPCAEDSSLNQTYGTYQTHTQYGYFAFRVSPVQRAEIRVGYNVVDNQGTTTNFNNLLPLGPLASTYQSPLAAVDILIHKDVTFKAGWNYYQYNEGSFVGPTAPRYFHANNTTLALKYAF